MNIILAFLDGFKQISFFNLLVAVEMVLGKIKLSCKNSASVAAQMSPQLSESTLALELRVADVTRIPKQEYQ